MIFQELLLHLVWYPRTSLLIGASLALVALIVTVWAGKTPWFQALFMFAGLSCAMGIALWILCFVCGPIPSEQQYEENKRFHEHQSYDPIDATTN